MTNEEAILKGLRELYKQNQEILKLLRPKPTILDKKEKEALEELVREFNGEIVPEKPTEGKAAKLMRLGMDKSGL